MTHDSNGAVRFALLGAAGYVAPRHMKAIKDTGNQLVVACDPHDGVGVLDRYFPDCKFFTEVERFDRHLEKLRRKSAADAVRYVSVCSPNYLHDAHCRLALRLRADAVCEKPLVISPWNLDQLAQIEEEYQRRIYNILQLRLHPEVKRLRAATAAVETITDVDLAYVTYRGPWYHRSWKGDERRSGGLVMNIGVHFFDMLIWLFGPVEAYDVTERSPDRVEGTLRLKRARVKWLLSTRMDDVPAEALADGRRVHRSLIVGDDRFDFSKGFEDLHTRVYEEIIAGRGFGIEDARAPIELVHRLRTCDVSG